MSDDFCVKGFALSPLSLFLLICNHSSFSFFRGVAQVATLRSQLEAHGVAPVADVVPLAHAHEMLRASTERLLAGDEAAERDVERWDAAVRNHPEHAAAEATAAAAWAAAEVSDRTESRCVEIRVAVYDVRRRASRQEVSV